MQEQELQIEMEVENTELQIEMESEEPEQSIELEPEEVNITVGRVNDVLVNGNSVVDDKIAYVNIKTVNNNSLIGTGNVNIPIPTKTSELTNDSGFITKDVNDLTNYYLKTDTYNKTETNNLLADKADKTEIPTKTSQLTNDSNFVNQTQMTNAIGEETTARQNADIDLQNQIDAITVSSDVIDVLGTYQDLVDYDTSHVKANDVIKVLQDSTHSNAMSYYRWEIVGSVGHWEYVGSEGPFYTKSESDSIFVPQTRTVNGKALSNNITLAASDVGALPDSTVIPTVYNGTLTIQKNGANVQTFTANQSTNVTANITVPTDTNDLTNGAGYITGVTSSDVTTALGFTPENVANKVTSISSSSTDTEYPSAKCVYDIVGDIETLLSEVQK